MIALRKALDLAVKIYHLTSSSSSSLPCNAFTPIVGGYPTFVYMVGLSLGYNLDDSSNISQHCMDSTINVNATLNSNSNIEGSV